MAPAVIAPHIGNEAGAEDRHAPRQRVHGMADIVVGLGLEVQVAGVRGKVADLVALSHRLVSIAIGVEHLPVHP